MATKKAKKRSFIKINKNGANILMSADPHVISVEGGVYEVERWLLNNIVNREGGEEIEEADARKLIKEPVEEPAKKLEDFTVPELKEICDQEGIEVEDGWKKADIIKAIREKSE